jgi:phage baseplate assembly protein W
MTSGASFLGTGVGFPFRLNKNGEIFSSSFEDSIEEAIKIVLSTKPGERLMRPDFGCRVHELMFAPNTVDTHNLAIYFVTEALKRWENRILVKEVTVHKISDTAIDINISYQIRDTNSFYNLVYPFYLKEYA